MTRISSSEQLGAMPSASCCNSAPLDILPMRPQLENTRLQSWQTTYRLVNEDIIQWEILEKSYPKYPSVNDLRITQADRDQWVDLRPYANTAAISVQETSSVHVRISHSFCNPRCAVAFASLTVTSLTSRLLFQKISVPTRSFEVWAFAFFPWSTSTTK